MRLPESFAKLQALFGSFRHEQITEVRTASALPWLSHGCSVKGRSTTHEVFSEAANACRKFSKSTNYGSPNCKCAAVVKPWLFFEGSSEAHEVICEAASFFRKASTCASFLALAIPPTWCYPRPLHGPSLGRLDLAVRVRCTLCPHAASCSEVRA